MKIPEQLQNQKFIKVAENKRPIEKQWQQTANYNYNDKDFNEWLEMNSRYGVLCGINNLIVVDFDNKALQEEILPLLPETFTVQTARKKLLHLYFYSDGIHSFSVKDKDKNTLCDVQGEGKQAIGPGTIVAGTGTYTLIKNIPIMFLPMKKLHDIVDPYNYLKLVDKQESSVTHSKDQRLGELNKLVRISEILENEGIDVSHNPTRCPFHESIGGKCLGFDDNKGIWHCFDCDSGGTVIHLVSKIWNLPYADARKKLLLEHNIITDEIEDIKISVLQYLLKKDNNTATEVLAKYIKKAHPGITAIRNDEKTEIYFYEKNTGLTRPGGQCLINEVCRQVLEESHKTSLVSQVTGKIEADSYVDQDIFFNTNYAEDILCNNGILNIHTRELKPFDQEKRFFTKIPVKYELGIDCPNFKKHLKDVLPDESDITLMQEIFGYCLYKSPKFETAFVWIGGGSNGKTKTLEVLKNLLGAENVLSYSLQELEEDQYAEAHLFGKLANLAGELGFKALEKTDKFKKIIGGDELTANRKFLTPIRFKSYAKMIFSCNELPRSKDDSLGFWRRWNYIKFPYQFVDKKDYDAAIDKHLLKLKDPDIIEKISTPQELTGILNWALDGLKRLLKQNHFSKSFSTDEVKSWWFMQSDSFKAFCSMYIEVDYTGSIDKKELRDKYDEYCTKYSLKKLNDTIIANVLKFNYDVETKQDWARGRIWTGISWKKVSSDPTSQKTLVEKGEGGVLFLVESSRTKEMYDNSIQVDESISLENEKPNMHNRQKPVFQPGKNFESTSNQFENGQNPVRPVRNTKYDDLVFPDFSQLQSILLDVGEIEIIELLGKGFSDDMIKSWMASGSIIQSRPGYIRLM